MRAILLIAVAAVMAAAGRGCSDEDEAKEAVEAYLTAIADGDGEAACKRLDASGRRAVVEGAVGLLPELELDCVEIVEQVAALIDETHLDGLRDAEIASVRVDAGSATDGSVRKPAPRTGQPEGNPIHAPWPRGVAQDGPGKPQSRL